MEKANLSNKVFTENPLLDEIIYNIRQILSGGIVIKDWDKANDNETVDSIKNGDLLVTVKSGAAHFGSFYYDRELLSKYYISGNIDRYVENNNLIPKADRPAILSLAITEFLDNYVELNNYYRMLHGEPYYDETGAYEGLWIDIRTIDATKPTPSSRIYYMRPTVAQEEEQYYQLIHELPVNYKNILYENGTCENFVNDTDRWSSWDLTKNMVLYLLHIGDREIDYYDARAADRFSLLYCPSCTAEEVRIRFKDLFEANRLYTLYTVYSEAYKHRSEYYDNFITIFLIIQTIIDMVVELPEYIIRRDIFDTRTCKYIFESNGVKYFKDIPLKYQVSLVKNLNKLIKFKSTDKCIVDIISIFGVENIEVFKYYILKDRKVTDKQQLDYFDNTKEVTDSSTGETHSVADNDDNYDLKFIKVPMFGNYDDCIRNDSKVYDYDTIVEADRYWVGDRDDDNVRRDIKDLDFTVLRSKYYSIEAVIDLAKRNFTAVYFMNLLMRNNVDKSALQVNIPTISTTKKFELVNAILTLFSLSYVYYGVEDTIIDTKSKIATILGFNMEADLAKISNWLYENHRGLTLKDLHVDTFIVPDNNKIMSFAELENMFFTNKDCYDHVVHLLNNPPTKEIYDAYRYIYKSLMTMNRNMESFLIGDNPVVDEYKQLGYKSKFINIPTIGHYTNPDDFERDYRWLLESIEDNDLCFEISDNFVEDHLFNVYIKEPDQERLTHVGTAQMAYTYQEYLKYADIQLFSFINKIKMILDVESRQEACINAIQSIVSSLKNYIDQTGEDGIPLDNVFIGIPSISVDFIKRYITEVIDFFKSFKIFTHESSILYVIQDKFGNYVQLIEHILLKYLLDKSELVRIEDAIHNMTSSLTMKERHSLIDKIWLDISTWIQSEYSDYYNSDNYQEAKDRIKDYYEFVSTIDLNDSVFVSKYEEIQDYTVEAILNMLVTLKYSERVSLSENTIRRQTHILDDYYNEWVADLAKLVITLEFTDRTHFQDDYIRFNKQELRTMPSIADGFVNNHVTFASLSDIFHLRDSIYTIRTQSYPAHFFN